MRHLMIDLETLSTAPTAAIRQIGAVWFDPEGSGVHEAVNLYVDPQDCIDRGCAVDWSTIQWWLCQSRDAQLSMATTQPREHSLHGALNALVSTAASIGEVEGVWGNGSTFDIVILEHAFRLCGITPPWNFWNHRDLRTLRWHHPEVPRPTPAIAHNALSDAIAQAQYVQDIMRDNAKVGAQ